MFAWLPLRNSRRLDGSTDLRISSFRLNALFFELRKSRRRIPVARNEIMVWAAALLVGLALAIGGLGALMESLVLSP